MHIELSDEERRLAQQGQPLDAIDPQTNEAYVLIAKPRFEEVRSHLGPVVAALAGNGTGQAEAPELDIPEGVRLSKEAYRRELPELLKQKKLARQWVAYHRNDRICIGRDGGAVLEECFNRGLAADEFFVGWIDPCGFEVDEEVEPRLHHYVEHDDEIP